MKNVRVSLCLFAGTLALASCDSALAPQPRCAADGQCAGTDRCVDGECVAGDERAPERCDRAVSVEMRFEHMLDLDSGAIYGSANIKDVRWDIKMSLKWDADPPAGLVLHHDDNGVLIGRALTGFCDDIDVAQVELSPHVLDIPFEETLIVVSDTGARYALGEPVLLEDRNAVAFRVRDID